MQINNLNTINHRDFINEESLKHQIKQFSRKCLENLFAVKQEDIIFYINLLKPYILFHPLYWYVNPLVKLIKEHVGNELPTCFLNSIKEVEENDEFQNAVRDVCGKYANMIYTDGNITEEQVEELLEIPKLSSCLSYETILNFIIKKLLSKDLSISSELYQVVFFRFIEQFRIKNNGNFCACTKKIPDLVINGREVIRNAAVKKKYGRVLMQFNSNTLYSENITKNLFVFFHEFWHTIQDEEDVTPEYLRRMFKMDTFLCDQYSEYRENNYYQLSYECDANLNGLNLLLQYLNSIGFDKYNSLLRKKMLEFSEKRDNHIRIDKYGNEICLEDYYKIGMNKQISSGISIRLSLETKRPVSK